MLPVYGVSFVLKSKLLIRSHDESAEGGDANPSAKKPRNRDLFALGCGAVAGASLVFRVEWNGVCSDFRVRRRVDDLHSDLQAPESTLWQSQFLSLRNKDNGLTGK